MSKVTLNFFVFSILLGFFLFISYFTLKALKCAIKSKSCLFITILTFTAVLACMGTFLFLIVLIHSIVDFNNDEYENFQNNSLRNF